MKLKWRLIIFFGCASLAITITLGALLYHQLRKDRFSSVRTDTLEQLRHVAFSLGIFFDEAEKDVLALARNQTVRFRRDHHFTNFTKTDEQTFEYRMGDLEQQIIHLFETFRVTHPYVNSVYMGRENGSFVRSHKRARPTRYDPRTRPWYIQAKRFPDQAVLTEPYPSLTTTDVNIGIEKALVDDAKRFYGVVGMDITLAKLTDYILNFKIRPDSMILVVDRKGMILASRDKEKLFSKVGKISKPLEEILLSNHSGKDTVALEGTKNFVYFSEVPNIGWKVVVLIPAASIEREIRYPILLITSGLVFGLLLMSLLSLLGLNAFVIRPLDHLSQEASRIAETSDLEHQIRISSSDELGTLASSFNDMIRSLNLSQKALKDAKLDLIRHQEHLEYLVKERTEELALARDKAQESDRLKSTFLASMSHELRTPLNSIIGFTGILLQGMAGPVNEEQIKQLNMVRNSAHHLLQLINEVLDISKIEAGELKLEPGWFDLSHSIEAAVKMVQPLADKKGILIKVNAAPSTDPIFHDQRRVEQVLINLINNAVKFTEQGEVTVQWERDSDQVTVSVRDTGIGIKPEDMAILFETFRQIETGLTRRYEGTGLGLSISRRLVEMMGGRIRADSDGLGRGSVFTFTLPAKKGEEHETENPDYRRQ